MALEIVWRNPALRQETERWLERLMTDEYGVLYAIRSQHEIRMFELIVRGAA